MFRTGVLHPTTPSTPNPRDALERRQLVGWGGGRGGAGGGGGVGPVVGGWVGGLRAEPDGGSMVDIDRLNVPAIDTFSHESDCAK